ncbi:MAG: hypothetical protein GY832_26125 [Chloroflexi bacterium]|nr:hypothetical protein [Chloroflexota bacterium]
MADLPHSLPPDWQPSIPGGETRPDRYLYYVGNTKRALCMLCARDLRKRKLQVYFQSDHPETDSMCDGCGAGGETDKKQRGREAEYKNETGDRQLPLL